MPLQTIEPEYDLVFAGGGTAACIIAGRLIQAVPHLKILLLESGPTTKDKLEHIQPARYRAHWLPATNTMQFYQSKTSADTANRTIIVPSGKCVGGGKVHLCTQPLLY